MKIRFGLLAVKNPIEKMFEVASQSGISHIEIDLIKDHSYVESFGLKRIAKIKNLAKNLSDSTKVYFVIYNNNPVDRG